MAKSKKQQARTEKTKSSPNSGEITWGEIKRRAAKEADKVAQAIRSKPQQFCQYVIAALDIASYYVIASRVSPENRNIDSGQFLSTYLRLAENLKRAEKLLQTSPKLLDKWSQNPNAVLGHIAGWSALVVAHKFSKKVENAVTIARVFTLGVGCGKDFFDAIVPSDRRVRAWLDAAVTELQTRTLPPVPDWPIWKVRRDVESLYYQLLAEREKEDEQPGSGGKNRQPKTKGWKPPKGYIGSKEIVNNRSVPRTTLQCWQERDPPKVKQDPQTQENYYPQSWFEKHYKNYRPRGRDT
jgi:hypothetical protein